MIVFEAEISMHIKQAACIGGGVIGAGWVSRLILSGVDVKLFDPHPDAERIVDEGATLVTSGTRRPEHLNCGCFVRPTVFADVSLQMTIANTEIFSPVMTMVGYETKADAIRIANDTDYGLAADLQASDLARARRVARLLRAGQVEIS
jgi:acyl-CoA reductase-like NAD-dependent aldehyde dehydrogenase